MNKTRSHFHISKKINQLNLFYIYMLHHYGVKLILVFDGGFLPIKGDHETKCSQRIYHVSLRFTYSYLDSPPRALNMVDAKRFCCCHSYDLSVAKDCYPSG
jgi:hypothetical protein